MVIETVNLNVYVSAVIPCLMTQIDTLDPFICDVLVCSIETDIFYPFFHAYDLIRTVQLLCVADNDNYAL